MMLLSVLDRLGNWNPQLFRELKGRLTGRNSTIAIGLSLLGQLLLGLYAWSQLPFMLQGDRKVLYRSPYCTGHDWSFYDGASCFILRGKPLTNWQLWSADLFFLGAWIGCIVLLVAGTYLLVSDLDREERHGTLNFLRLSPQSVTSIFIGKLLGVPCLLYLGIGLAIPMHLWVGLNAKISLSLMLGFYLLLGVATVFVYSSALLFGLATTWMKGVQPWLASGVVFFFSYLLVAKQIDDNGTDLMNLFHPNNVLPYLTPQISLKQTKIFGRDALSLLSHLRDWKWFELSIGTSFATAFSCTILNYGLWIAIAWQGLQRRFRNPNAPLISKRSSYFVTTYFTLLSLGFNYSQLKIDAGAYQYAISIHWNILLFSILIFALSPPAQTLLDWSRHRIERSKNRTKYSLVSDLIWGDKSPATVAIVLNIFIVAGLSATAFLLSSKNPIALNKFLASIALNLNFMLVCASIVQLILFMKAPKRTIWAVVSLGTLIVAPVVILLVLSIEPRESFASLWLLTSFAEYAAPYASISRVFQALLIHLTIFSFCTWQFYRRLKTAGESHSKALLTAHRG